MKTEKNRRYIYRLLDKGCSESKTSSMARTTGYTATAIANYFLLNNFEPGICAPEVLGSIDGAYQFILDYLQQRNVDYKVEEFTLD